MTTWRKLIGMGLAASFATLSGVTAGPPVAAQNAGIDTEAPGAPRILSIEKTVSGPARGATLSWTTATDNVGIAEYWIYVNGEAIAVRSETERNVVLPDLPARNNFIQVAALDVSGNWSRRSSPSYIFIDHTPPTAPLDLEVVQLDADTLRVAFERSRDESAVRYRMWINGKTSADLFPLIAQPLFDGTDRASVELQTPRGEGTWYIQLTAEDIDRNVSPKSPPTRVEIPYFDNSRPSAPVVTADIIQFEYVELNWNTPDDNVGVTAYVVLETGVGPWGVTRREIAITGATSFGAPPLIAGPAWYQVMAVDQQGNRSVKSPPIRVNYPLVPAII